ncbi:MAG: FAD-binding oxidoreductase [Actinobacteria bacterium]|nr:FAD-binding oxidoreductase [Actinomycetota bacterium]
MIGRYDDEVSRWGVPPEPIELSDRAREFLTQRVGPPRDTQPVVRRKIDVPASRIDVDDLRSLAIVVGDGDVSTGDDDRLAHGGGFSYLDLLAHRGEHPLVPDAVVSPKSHDVVRRLLEFCEQRSIAVIPFGGGTSVVGGVRPETGRHVAVIAVSFDNMADLIDVDDVNMTATMGPGITGPTLERLLKTRGFTLGHFPQSWERASIGGYVATRSAGQASAGYGRSDEMVERLKVACVDRDFTLGRAPGSAAGPDLRQLFIGSEGIFGLITEVTLRIRRLPNETRLEGVMFPSYESGLDAFRELVARRATADVMRLSDPEESLTNLTMATDGAKASALNSYLKLRKVNAGSLAIFSWEGTHTQVGARRDEAWRVMRKFGAVSLSATVGKGWEHGRFSGPYLRDALLDRGYLVETLETATGWRELPELRRSVTEAIRNALPDDGPGPWVMSHLSHVYETGGSLYITIIANRDDDNAVAQWQRAKTAASEAIVAAQATITHHHAVGRDHAPWLTEEIGESGVELLAAIKRELDPTGILNPGVLIPVQDS